MFWIKNIGMRYRVPGTDTSREALACACHKLREVTGEIRPRQAYTYRGHADREQARGTVLQADRHLVRRMLHFVPSVDVYAPMPDGWLQPKAIVQP